MLIVLEFFKNHNLGFWVWWCSNLTRRQQIFWVCEVRNSASILPICAHIAWIRGG